MTTAEPERTDPTSMPAHEAERPPRADTLEERGSLRELLRVALPLVISSGSVSLMHVVDRMFLTWWSVDALAASLPAGVLFWAVLSLPFGIAVYTNTFVAQYSGAARKERVVASVWQGVWLAVAGGVLVAACAPFSEAVFRRWVDHEEAVLQLETSYFAILCLGAIPTLMQVALSAFFSGRGQTLVVMWVNLFVSLLDGVLNYFMVFGKGPFPEMGMRGAAWSTNISQLVACLLFLGLLSWQARSDGYPLWTCRRWDSELLWRLLRFGAPNGVQFLVDVGAFTLFVLFIGRIGKVELAASNLAFNLNSMAFIPMFGLGTAVMTLVGQRIGERRPALAVRTTRLAFALSGAYMLTFAALYVLVPQVMLAPYAAYGDFESFAEVRPVVVTLLRFVALYSFFDAMAIVFGSAIRGAGDTQFSLWWTFGTGWLLMVLPAWLATAGGRGSLLACWTAATVYITVLGIGFALRFRTGRWQSMTVIDHVPESEASLSAAEDGSLLEAASQCRSV